MRDISMRVVLEPEPEGGYSAHSDRARGASVEHAYAGARNGTTSFMLWPPVIHWKIIMLPNK